VVTDPQSKNAQTDSGDYNTLRRSFASAQCNNHCFALIIARQHAMRAERNIVMAFLYVGLPVSAMPVLHLNEWIDRQTF